MDNTEDRLLPMTRAEMQERGWRQCDYILVTGDAYIDHSSIGAAVISRVLESLGNRVGIISQPRWDRCDDFTVLGRPEKAFLVTSGAVDSMVSAYSASLRPRAHDSYTPGGKPGGRPKRSIIAYTARIRQAYKDIPVIAGGLEASLRRLSHYDYWSNSLRRSILLDAKLDLLVYGMGEQQITEIDRLLSCRAPLEALHCVPGTVYAVKADAYAPDPETDEVMLPDFHSLCGTDAASRRRYAESTHTRMVRENPMKPCRLLESYGPVLVVQNPPAAPLEAAQMDRIYELPYTRRVHPGCLRKGEVRALTEVRFSITSSRGCYGSCSFCSLRAHQGRIIQARSRESILREARSLTDDPLFKGYIHDVGGPTANFRIPACRKQITPGKGPCEHRECLFPDQCPSVRDGHASFLEILTDIRTLPKVKQVFVRSGIRYDHLMHAPKHVREGFLLEICRHHVSGQLKVAPEHASPRALHAMGKPSIELFTQFHEAFRRTNRTLGKKQYLIPYLIASHPGCDLTDAVLLAEFLHDYGFIPDQIQDFYPTPGTAASAMYWTQLDPRPGMGFSPVHVPVGRERTLQRALLHFHKRENRKLVIEALEKAGRGDLKQKLLGKRPG